MSSNATTISRPSRLLRFTAALLLLCGLSLAIPGLLLIALGGSPYYTVAGAGLAVSGILLWRARMAGAWLFLAVVTGTAVWAFWEAGLDGWALMPRLGLFVLLALLLAFALLRNRRKTARSQPKTARSLGVPAATAVTLLGLTGAAILLMEKQSSVAAIQQGAAPASMEGEWRFTGGSSRSDRFTGLQQITPGNVSRLKLAWQTHLGMPPGKIPGALQATPLMVNDRLYMCNMHNEVIALDLETGKPLWRFDPKIDMSAVFTGTCRGVAYYEQPGATGLCSTRIISFAIDARMFALDARTGQRCSGFGNNGEVSLLDGMGVTKTGYYYLTSAPVIVRGKVVVGGSVLDGQETGEPSGVIRGFDAVTGKFAWAWDMGRSNDHGLPAAGQTYTLGTPNAWAPLTGDEELGLVYAPLGNATPDYVSVHRSPEMNKYASSVVAIDAETGALRWYFQTTHRDVWDYDVASPPTLMDFPTAQGLRPGLIQPTKRGQFFVLDRRTGQPLVKTVERPVPQNPVPGEQLSPTQPYPVGMPSFGGERLTEAHMWGLTPFDQLWCRIKFKEARYDGDFTPIGLKPTIVYPGYLGGSEWAGVAVDPERKLMALNVNHFAMYNQMIRRADADRDNIKPFKAGVAALNIKAWPQAGTPYATKTGGFLSPLDTPCIKPPYSEIAVVDLNTRKTLWRQPLGTGRDTGPFGIPSMLPIRMGVPAMGGPLVTRSGLIFIAATQERTFRAFDVKTGKLLWQDRLPAGGHAAPMSYYSRRSGRQFIVIPASGHSQMRNGMADYLLAYALPPNGASPPGVEIQ